MENQQPKKETAYLVLTIEELTNSATPEELMVLDGVMTKIVEYRKANGQNTSQRFLVVSAEEPYFTTVSEFVKSMKKQFGG